MSFHIHNPERTITKKATCQTTGLIWKFYERTINVTDYRNAKDDVDARAKANVLCHQSFSRFPLRICGTQFSTRNSHLDSSPLFGFAWKRINFGIHLFTRCESVGSI
jgi:hypothetical protein